MHYAPSIKIENAVDFRTQRPTKNPVASKRARKRRMLFKAKGICYSCEKEPTAGKSICKQCSDRITRYSERRVLLKYGCKLPYTLMTEAEKMASVVAFAAKL